MFSKRIVAESGVLSKTLVTCVRDKNAGGWQWKGSCPMPKPKCGDHDIKGLVLGVYTDDKDPNQEFVLTRTAKAYDERVKGKLCDMIEVAGHPPKEGETKVFYGLDPIFNAVALVGMGLECVSYNAKEHLDERKELIRTTAGIGVRTLQDNHMDEVHVESFGHSESAAEGAALAAWVYQEMKSEEERIKIPKLELYEDCDYSGWNIGLVKAAAQNLTRQLTETPANFLTPLSFSQMAIDVLGKANVNVEAKMKRWAEIMGLGGFLSAAKGSCEPPVFLEASYFGCEQDVSPIVLIGKGVTFDSGGLCIKEGKDLKHGKTNMSGAAMAVSVVRAASALQLPLNIKCILPLFENMPGACAYHPGDVICTRSGKTVVVENTDFDGRLSLVDAISYSQCFNPAFILDIGMMTKECGEAMGQAATVGFSNDDRLFENLRMAGVHTGDRVWRFPLWEYYSLEVTNNLAADAGNPDDDCGAPCTCAAFLYEFVPNTSWIHLDTCGVARSDGRTWPYLRKGSSGRPTRTVVEFLAALTCKEAQEQECVCK